MLPGSIFDLRLPRVKCAVSQSKARQLNYERFTNGNPSEVQLVNYFITNMPRFTRVGDPTTYTCEDSGVEKDGQGVERNYVTVIKVSTKEKFKMTYSNFVQHEWAGPR